MSIIAQNAFKLPAPIAERYSHIIAKEMQKEKLTVIHCGQYTGHGMTEAMKRAEKTRARMLESMPKEWTTTVDIGNMFGISVHRAKHILERMLDLGLVEKEKTNANTRVWRPLK